MKIAITKSDKAFIIFTSLLLVSFSTIGWFLVGAAIIHVSAVIAMIIILFSILETYRRMKAILVGNLRNQSRQMESLLACYFTLNPTLPFPKIGAWTLLPDLLSDILRVIYEEKPSLVLELGSGISTIIIGYCLKKLGRGRVISLEHNKNYAAISRDNIKIHGLQNIAIVLYAPLIEYNIKGKKWIWYDIKDLELKEQANLVLIDGPPLNIQKFSRYPALPILNKYLADSATIILDDGDRVEERKIVEMWSKEFMNITIEYVDVEKGAFIIRKQDPNSN